jgi:hypothetical protein
MIKNILLISIVVILTSCTSTISEKMPTFEKKQCTGEKAKTLADLYCKK